MKFDEIMNFGGEANWVTYQKIKEAIKSGNVLPFIGAGLSKDAGYPLWTEALRILSKFSKPAEQTYIDSIIESDPEETADRIENSIGSRKMHDYLVDIFSEKTDLNTRKSTVGILPYLFPSQLIMTTNFDHVVENAYRTTKGIHLKLSIPSDRYLRDKLLAGTTIPSIYKIHGDIFSDFENIVFSKASYNKHYSGSTSVTKTLSAAFIAKHLFFLGCSLQNDRTLRLLQSLATEGTTHFAIVDEDAENVWDRRKELSENFGIDAILYPSGNYECVKVILSRLLEDIDSDAFQSCIACRVPIDTSTNRFVYTSLNTDFIGRDNELQELIHFIQGDERPVTWWALTGAGGSGKSRLVYELIKHIENYMDGWHSVTFKRSERTTTELLTRRIRAMGGNVFIAIDYMQTGLSRIAEWIDSLNPGSGCIRVLFLQRDGVETLDQDILPSWLREVLNAIGNLRSLLWRPQLLFLKPWNDPEIIKKLMRSYATHMNRPGELDAFLDELCEALRTKDERLMLPLFAMFIADAKLEGNDPCQWDAEQLFNWFCKREQDMHLKQLEGIHESLGSTCLQDYELLIVLATIINTLEFPASTNDVYTPYKELIHTISSVLHISESKAVTKGVECGILVSDNESNTLKICGLEPDPFGEFFVLWFLHGLFLHHDGRKTIVSLIFEVSQDKSAGSEFFFRAFTDYGEYLEEEWLTLKDYLCSLNDWINQSLNLSVAERILYCALETLNRDTSTSEKAMIKAGYIAQKNNKNRIANLMYAQGLVNLINVQVTKNQMNTIALLQALCKQFPKNEEFDVIYANGLYNISINQDKGIVTFAIAELRTLMARYPQNENIAIAYTGGLFHLSNLQDTKDREATTTLICTIYEHFLTNEAIALEYARALFNLSVYQNGEGVKVAIAYLRTLTDRFPDNVSIALKYANGLFNLSVVQEKESRMSTIALIHTVTERFPNTEKIILTYSKGLVNLTAIQDTEDYVETVTRLGTIMEQFPDNEEIALEYAMGLTNLNNKQALEESIKTVTLLSALSERFIKNESIAIEYALGLFNLSKRQEVKDCAATISMLRELTERFSENVELATGYALGLFNLSVKQDQESCTDTINSLYMLTKQFPKNEEIALAYAKGLVNLSIKQDTESAEKTIGLLHTLTEQWSSNEEITQVYARGLGELSEKQVVKNCLATISLLRTLTEQWPKNEEIAQVYAKALGELSVKQDIKNCETTVGLLYTLAEQWPENEEIALAHAVGLGILFNRQQGSDQKTTLECLRSLAEIHINNEIIAMLYDYLKQSK